jgi:two-component system phosphate regulon sensor histidine kinase PhoR
MPGRTRGRVASAVLSAQMLISAVVLILIAAGLLIDSQSFSSPTLFGGIALVFVLTAVAAILPWDAIDRRWAVILPFLNIVAINAVRDAAPQFGAGLLLIFPVIWIARTFGVRATIAGVLLSTGGLWLNRLANWELLSTRDFGSLVLLPLCLMFIAVSTYLVARRTRAQGVLLRQHSTLIEASLEKARNQELTLNEVLNAVDFGVIAFDRHGKVTLVNRAHRQALADFGTPPDAVIHRVVYHPDRVTPYGEAERPFTRALAGQSFDNLIVWAGAPGGRQAAYSCSSRTLHGRDGEFDGCVVILHDVTAELEAIRGRDDLIGSVSHELRSPLTSVLGYIDLARDEEDMPAEARRMLDVAYSNSERLLVIVTDLLRAASDADKQLAISFVPCDITEIAAASVESHQVFADEREVELTLAGSATAPAHADPVRMRQVIDNLVTNAIKYNREWGTVTVTVEVEHSGVTVEVLDTGQGIPEADISRIFDRFYRTTSARNSQTVGSGLGLSITREIVHRHGGELSVHSELGIGTTFRLTIPTSRDAAAISVRESVSA